MDLKEMLDSLTYDKLLETQAAEADNLTNYNVLADDIIYVDDFSQVEVYKIR